MVIWSTWTEDGVFSREERVRDREMSRGHRSSNAEVEDGTESSLPGQGAHAGDGFIEIISCSSMENLITKGNRMPEISSLKIAQVMTMIVLSTVKQKGQAPGSVGGERLVPETHEAEIQAEDDVTKVRKDSADIMNESRSIRKWAPSRIQYASLTD